MNTVIAYYLDHVDAFLKPSFIIFIGLLAIYLFVRSKSENMQQKLLESQNKQLKMLSSGSEGEVRLQNKLNHIFSSLKISYLTNQLAGYKDAVLIYDTNKSYEIDLILITNFGIYVIEAKDWFGSIEKNTNSNLLTVYQNNKLIERKDPSSTNLKKLNLLIENTTTPIHARALTVFTNLTTEIDLTLPTHIKHINDLTEYFRNENEIAKKTNRPTINIEELKKEIFVKLDSNDRAKHFHMMRLIPSADNNVGEYHILESNVNLLINKLIPRWKSIHKFFSNLFYWTTLIILIILGLKFYLLDLNNKNSKTNNVESEFLIRNTGNNIR